MNTQTINIETVYLQYLAKYFQKFMPLTHEELLGLLQYCEFRKFDKKTVIVQEGEIDDYLNMVVKGLVMKYVRVKKCNIILQLATEGHVIHSEISFLSMF